MFVGVWGMFWDVLCCFGIFWDVLEGCGVFDCFWMVLMLLDGFLNVLKWKFSDFCCVEKVNRFHPAFGCDFVEF
jgi:hypothetical protein